MRKPTDEEASVMVSTLDDAAYAAFKAVIPICGTDSNAILNNLVDAAIVVGMAAGVSQEDFAAGVKANWDRRALALSGVAGSA